MVAISVTVSGTVQHPLGGAAFGQISFTMPTALLDGAGNKVLTQSKYRTVLVNGAFALPLPAGNSPGLSPSGWSYRVEITVSGNQRIVGSIFVDAANAGGGQQFGSTFEPGAETSTPLHYVRRTGDTMTGPLVLPGDPTTNLQAATKHYVDTHSGGGGGGGAVSTVFGRTGDVVAANGDYATAQITGLVASLNARANLDGGAAFTGGAVTVGGQVVVVNNDARLTDSRTPTAHAASHALAGSDVITISESQVTGLTTDLASKQPLDADLTTIAGLTATTTNIIQSVGGLWASRTPSQLKSTLGLVKGDVGLDLVDNTSDASKPVSSLQQAALDLKADLVGGFVPTSQLPALAINEIFTVASQSAMLALTAQRGDMAIRTDTEPDSVYVLSSDSPSTLADWKPISFGTVTSVNGQQGIIVLGKADIGLGSVDNTSDAGKPVSSAQQTALDLKANLASPTFTGTVSGVTAAMVGAQPVDGDLSTIAGLTATTDNIIQSVGGAWASRTPAQVKTSLALVQSDVGLGNVNNTSDLGKPISTLTQAALDGKQPLDSDLTTLAGLTATTDNMIQSVGSAWASRTPAQVKAALAIAQSDVTGLTAALGGLQPLDSDLTAIAAIAPANDDIIQRKAGAWTNRTIAQLVTDLGLGSVYQPLDADLTTLAGLTATTNNFIMSVGSAWASRTPAQVKTTLAIVESDVTNLTTDLAAKAPLASPTFTGTVTTPRIITPPVVLTPGTTVSVDASLGNYFRLTPAQSFTLANPTNLTDGQLVMFEIIQDGTGSRVLTLGSNYALGTDIAAVVLSTGANKVDYIGCRYNSTAGKLRVIAFVKGY